MRKSKLAVAAEPLRGKATIRWDNKKWDATDLLVHLAKEVRRLRRSQCKPCTACVIRYEDFYDELYGPEENW